MTAVPHLNTPDQYINRAASMHIYPCLFSCEACGFLSTLGSEYTLIQGVRFDKECAEKYRDGIQPVATWVAEKLPKHDAHVNAVLGHLEREFTALIARPWPTDAEMIEAGVPVRDDLRALIAGVA